MADVTDEEWHNSACGATHKPKTLEDHAAAVERVREKYSSHFASDVEKLCDCAFCIMVAAYDAAILELKAEREARVKAEEIVEAAINWARIFTGTTAENEWHPAERRLIDLLDARDMEPTDE
jgi:biotin synthase-like enzyme